MKGANFEREIVKAFWEVGWAAVRAAGSGTTKYPVPDVIAVKDKRIILVECKTTKKDRLNIKKAAESLKKYADLSGGNAYIAIKFYKTKPRFYEINNLLSRKSYTVTDTDQYLSMDAIIGKQKIL